MTHAPLTLTRGGRVPVVVSLLLLSGIILDIQYGSLSPLVGVIAEESQLTSAQVGWVFNALMIGIVVSVSLSARMGDVFGHRRVLIALTILAMIGAALAATSSGFVTLVVGRLLMGMAVTIPLSWGLLRPQASSQLIRRVALAVSLVMAVCSPAAMVVGGFIVQLGLPWQTVFWVTFALFGILLVLALIVPESPVDNGADIRFDWFGSLGLGVWVTALLLAVSEGPSLGWTSPLVVGSVLVGAVVLVAWIIQQRRTSEPVVSFRNMDVRQALVGYSGILLPAIVGQGIFIALPALLQTPTGSGFGLGLTTLESTYVLLAIIPGSVVGYFWTGWGITHLGPRIFLLVSGIGGIGAFLGFTFARDEVWQLTLWVFVYALTIMCVLTTGYTLIAAAGRQDNMAVTIGLQYIVQFAGSAVPVAIVVNLLAPGPDGFIPETAFTVIYIASAVAIALFVILWSIAAPRTISDLHAIDAAQQVTPSVAAPVTCGEAVLQPKIRQTSAWPGTELDPVGALHDRP
ncbi:MFS transporter [Arthrobacter sp. B0490]|uniref:MFS transporter n=1 Tax=Arthrobacter sp. B0490 TaxID=2058891 RepID=UPI000CE474D0|nr:MFS transporter [Arthrobacter sp. B0490]